MITITVKEDEVSAALDRAAAAMADLTPIMQELGELLTVSTKERFAQGVSPEGIPWAPKSEATIAAYMSRGDPIDFSPLFGPSRRLSSEVSCVAGRDRLEIGSSLEYAASMHLGVAKGAHGSTSRGSSIPWGDIPARPFLAVSAKDRGLILEAVEEWLTEAAGTP